MDGAAVRATTCCLLLLLLLLPPSRPDVIEISDAVVRQASDYFQYERCEPAAASGAVTVSTTSSSDATTTTTSSTDATDPSTCPHGATFVTDGLAFLQQTPASPRPYDLFIIDVYTGWNPVAFYEKEVMARVRDAWLRASSGVLVVNFVGLFNGPHAVVPKSIFRTLQSVFAHVQCYRCVFGVCVWLWMCMWLAVCE